MLPSSSPGQGLGHVTPTQQNLTPSRLTGLCWNWVHQQVPGAKDPLGAGWETDRLEKTVHLLSECLTAGRETGRRCFGEQGCGPASQPWPVSSSAVICLQADCGAS